MGSGRAFDIPIGPGWPVDYCMLLPISNTSHYECPQKMLLWFSLCNKPIFRKTTSLTFKALVVLFLSSRVIPLEFRIFLIVFTLFGLLRYCWTTDCASILTTLPKQFAPLLFSSVPGAYEGLLFSLYRGRTLRSSRWAMFFLFLVMETLILTLTVGLAYLICSISLDWFGILNSK